MKKKVKIMSAEHVMTEIVVDSPKQGKIVHANGSPHRIIRDKKFGYIIQLDKTYAPHMHHNIQPGWFFTHWGVVTLIVILTIFLIIKLSQV